MGRIRLDLPDQLLQIRREPPLVADDTDPCPAFDGVFFIADQIALHQGHEIGYLVLGPLPVFRGKGVDRKILRPHFRKRVIDGFYIVGPGLVALAAQLAISLGPSAVTVQDDRHMLGDLFRTQIFECHSICLLPQGTRKAASVRNGPVHCICFLYVFKIRRT